MTLLNRWQMTSMINRFLAALIIAALMISCGFLVYYAGGIKYVYSYTMFLPIILAAILFKTKGGILAGVIGGLILGPYMPIDSMTGEMQLTFNWLFRMALYISLGTLVGQAIDMLDKTNLELLHAYDSTIKGWSYAMDLRDKETEGHCQRVTEMTVKIAMAMNEIDRKKLPHIYRGALLHDMGKMGIPDAILLKPGKLTEDEWEIMRRHPQYAYQMLSPIEYLHPALNIPYCHHEKWNGSGYPRGLRGEEIPLEARIFAIVDVYDALTSDRPYRKAWTKAETLEHIENNSGTHFDPQVVKLFLKLMSEDTLLLHNMSDQLTNETYALF